MTMRRFSPPLLALLLSVCFVPAHSQTIKQLFGFGCDPATKLCRDGKSPNSLIEGSDGNYYGTTEFSGGEKGASGTVFKVTSAGQLTSLYTFLPDQNNKYPNGQIPTSLVEGNDGFLYGTTQAGGASGSGVVFKLSKAGGIKVLHNFCSMANCGDGFSPVALTLASDGNLYGGTFGDGGVGGNVFRITPAGSFTILHSFDSVKEGPMILGLIQASDGNLYGTTVGAQTFLTCVFRLTRGGKFTLLQTFHYGQFTDSAPIQASNGKLYAALSRFKRLSELDFPFALRYQSGSQEGFLSAEADI